MAFQLSPGIQITERDLTDVVPVLGITPAAFAGPFRWGPAEQIVQIGSENELVEIFGVPDDDTFESFFTAANFLSYANNLQVVRAISDDAENARSTGTHIRGVQDNADMSSSSSSDSSESSSSEISSLSSSSSTSDNLQVKNRESYDSQTFSVDLIAKWPGKLGNSIHVSLVDDPDVFNDAWVSYIFGSKFDQATKFDAAPGTSTYVSNRNASNDELHIIIRDADGTWTGTPGTILEIYPFVSKASDALKSDGSSNYYKNILNDISQYVWWGGHPSGGTNWGEPATNGKTYDSVGQFDFVFTGGADGNADIVDADRTAAFDLFEDKETTDIGLIMVGEGSQTVSRHVVDLAASRADCVAFVSPEYSDIQPGITNAQKLTNVLNFEDTVLNKNTSFAVLDSGWKQQYDQYNDVFRWVPLNGDIAGLCARTDQIADPWFSPAGFSRGQIKNVIKLSWDPTQSQRDSLYKQGINPVVTFPGQGTVLYGDKTLLDRPSAFDRINVRRLFIAIEKAIARIAQNVLFEFNDEFTRSRFVGTVEPFLRDVQGRRGVTDFRVVCDTTNNTPEVIDRNEFVADIYIKPSRSINFIQLNFIATRTGISFDEII
jgi:hypothetical protein